MVPWEYRTPWSGEGHVDNLPFDLDVDGIVHVQRCGRGMNVEGHLV